MARLVVRQLRYQGTHWEYTSPELSDGPNIIVGPNGTGKTTFSDLLYYGLGGMVSKFHGTRQPLHKEIESDEENFVQLWIEVDGEPYVLKRYVGTNDIGIAPHVGHPEPVVLPILRRPGINTFSDWLLKLLGIEPVLLRQGSKKWMLGFNDLSRLLYHNQAPDPLYVFKPPDSANFISDSSYVRRTIFEVLMGTSHHELHTVIGLVHALDEKRKKLSSELSAFQDAAHLILGQQRDSNVTHVRAFIEDVDDQLQRVVDAIQATSESAESGSELVEEINAVRESAQPLERRRQSIFAQHRNLLAEMASMQQARRSLVLETTQIKKILFADDRLGLFSPDTCPYCLTEIERGANECICGKSIPEGEYKRFFYSPKEYLSLLRSRQKNVQTLDAALQDANVEAERLQRETKRLSEAVADSESKLLELMSRRRSTRAVPRKLAQLEDKRAELTVKLESLQRQLDLELKRQKLEDQLARVQEEYDERRIEQKSLDAIAQKSLKETRRRFNQLYASLLKETIANCRSARVSDDYDPIINNGEFLEASARVPIRLMFFAVLLLLSLEEEQVAFPRFLLVDTPQTAGIDPANLQKALGAMFGKLFEFDETAWQVILTTGPEMYPDELESRVVERLNEEKRLLVPTA